MQSYSKSWKLDPPGHLVQPSEATDAGTGDRRVSPDTRDSLSGAQVKAPPGHHPVYPCPSFPLSSPPPANIFGTSQGNLAFLMGARETKERIKKPSTWTVTLFASAECVLERFSLASVSSRGHALSFTFMTVNHSSRDLP